MKQNMKENINMKKIYIITGRTGSGKSTLCQKLSEQFNYPLLSFASMGNKFAKSKGYNRIRECHLAMELNEFKNQMSNHLFNTVESELENNNQIIIDGLYVDTVVLKLKEKYDCTLIYLNTDDEIRYERVAKRLSISIEQAREENQIKERLKDEVGINELIKISDYIVDGNKTPEEIFTYSCKILKNHKN